MRRREFITLVGGVAAWPLAARAQQAGSTRRVGVLMNGNETAPEFKAYFAAFVQGLRNLGWIDGQNLRLELRWASGDAERARTAATELLRLSPEVILSSSTANLTALLRQAPTMPIVFVQVSDPVAQGFISNRRVRRETLPGFHRTSSRSGANESISSSRWCPALHASLSCSTPIRPPNPSFS
jgi:putative ABC transport system substrate-binding protein